MVTLGTAITESVLHHYGRSALLSRLSDPFWFQALGSVMGMDWHSSGITTSVMGALKKGLNPRAHELGIYICGGRGRQSRNTPLELRQVAERTSLDGDALVRTSRLDGAHRQQRHRRRLPDLPALVHRDRRRRVGDRAAGHERREPAGAPLSLALGGGSRFHRRTAHGHRRSARRHDQEPGRPAGAPGTGCAARDRARRSGGDACRSSPAGDAAHGTRCAPRTSTRSGSAPCWRSRTSATCATSRRCSCSSSSVRARCNRWRWLPKSCTARPTRFDDPARFSFAHGGKDGHPFPVPLEIYDESIARAAARARRGEARRAPTKLDGFKRLDAFARVDRAASRSGGRRGRRDRPRAGDVALG